jgi:RNA polymerase sigma-70 factor (ECF subfamily)
VSTENDWTFSEVYDATVATILRFLSHRVDSFATAEDLTAQTYLLALRAFKRDRFQRQSDVLPWLYRIAANTANSHHRRQKNRWLQFFPDLPEVASLRSPQVELEAIEQERQRYQLYQTLKRAISQLKQRDQTLVVLRFFENKTNREVAQILNKKESAVCMATKRALKKLEILLEGMGVRHESFRDHFNELPETTVLRPTL